MICNENWWSIGKIFIAFNTDFKAQYFKNYGYPFFGYQTSGSNIRSERKAENNTQDYNQKNKPGPEAEEICVQYFHSKFFGFFMVKRPILIGYDTQSMKNYDTFDSRSQLFAFWYRFIPWLYMDGTRLG